MAQNPLRNALGIMGKSPFAQQFQPTGIGQHVPTRQPPRKPPFGYAPPGMPLPADPMKPPVVAETPPIVNPMPPVATTPPIVMDPHGPGGPSPMENPWHPTKKKKPITAYNT